VKKQHFIAKWTFEFQGLFRDEAAVMKCSAKPVARGKPTKANLATSLSLLGTSKNEVRLVLHD